MFLLLGLVTTVGVAWSAVLWPRGWGPEFRRFDTTLPKRWLLDAPADWPEQPSKAWTLGHIVRDNRIVGSEDSTLFRGSASWNQTESRAGLPMRVFHCFDAYATKWGEDTVRPELSRLQYGIELPPPLQGEPLGKKRLPILPIWPGLAFNTLFYAMLWYLAPASVRMVRHNRRYHHGLCPACRYDLMADYSRGCSECGWKR